MAINPSSQSYLELDVVVLGSGSSGNATLVSSRKTSLLIDCGFSGAELTRRLATRGLAPGDVQAVLLTHEHGDHVQALRPLARRPELRLVGSPGTLKQLTLGRRARCQTEALEVSTELAVGDLRIQSFSTSHDTAESTGYVIACGETRFGYATDLGCFDDKLVDALGGCDLLCIESNHDVDMLRDGPYPAFLKKRIASAGGHLSNDQSAQLLARVATRRLRAVCAMHLSDANNRSELAVETLMRALTKSGVDCPVTAASQSKVTPLEPRLQMDLFAAGAAHA